MAFELPPLPYAKDALAPSLSGETLEFHHGKHHQTYVDTLNELVDNERSTMTDLEELIRDSKPGDEVFNNAAQHWNHTFYWQCMKPGGGGKPTGELLETLNKAFGSFDDFRSQLADAASTKFGSGWAWLAYDGSNFYAFSSDDADLPLNHNAHALLTIDVWEHAYYIDFRNKRPDYVEAFLDNLVNWDFVAEQLQVAKQG